VDSVPAEIPQRFRTPAALIGGTMADPTPKQILEEQIPSRITAKPELLKEINAVIVFDIGGNKWTLDMTKPSDWVSVGAAEGVTPKMTVTSSEADFVAIATKKLNAQMAAMSGKLKFKPMDLNLAMKLGKLLA
jgi:putative sterol carrier protein